MPVQLDIAGNLGKGWGLREGISLAGEERRDRNRIRQGQKEALRIESGGTLSPEIASFYDPYEFKLGEMFKGVFSGEKRRERRNNRALASAGMPTTQQALDTGVDRMQMGTTPYAGVDRMQTFADGGRVEDENTYLGAVRDRIGRTANAAFPRLRQEMAEAGQAIPAAVQGWGNASARERGAMTRNALLETGSAAGEYVGALAEDVTAPLAPLGKAALGFIGFGGNPDEAAAAPPTTANDDVAVAIEENAPTEESIPTVTSPDGGGGAATPQSGAPFVGPPEPDQAAARLGNIEAMPDDMPSMGTRDWIAYREEMVPALMMQGMSASEAHQEVSAMQHQGFVRYGQQAAMMLQAGNQQGAARALKAAYQYFPNGADVRFGFQGDNLVAYATDEETGETTGTPQVITPEYLGSMMTNFQSPEKFIAWTKDWRDDAFTRQQYEEVTKPGAENLMNYRNRSLAISEQNAATNWLEAMTDASGEGGMTDSSLRAGDEAFRERVEMLGLEDEAAADDLARTMSAIRRQIPVQRRTDNEIITDVMNAYANGQLDEVKARLGIR